MGEIKRVAVIGTGGIGGSWAAYFLAQGLDVIATDVKSEAEGELRAKIRLYWETLSEVGLAPGASMERLRFVPNVEDAVRDADFVQENGPERIEIKHELFAKMSEAARPETPLVSSSSSLLVSDMQRDARHPDRVVLGHPFNPPHMIPLVEVAGGKLTSEMSISQVMQFYQAIGKKPIRLKREIFGHIANRLQTALWREAFYLIAEGIATAEDIDTAITEGPGMRSAINGPCMVWHVSGGRGGVRSTVAHMGPPTDAMASALYGGKLTTPMYQAFIESTEEMVKGKNIELLTRYRDRGLLEILKAKRVAHKILE